MTNTLNALLMVAGIAAAAENQYLPLKPVPFTAVWFQDEFWLPRLETNRLKSLPHLIEKCRETGRFDNFAKTAGQMEGKYEGYFFNDSDVYKVVEGACYVLAANPDPKLEGEIDEIIAKIAAAQQSDGYLNTYYTLTAPDERWSDIRFRHELYCAGHLIEAAVAHHRATGKRTLLDAAEKFADCINREFGPGKHREPPGHEEIELALVKLYQLTNKEKYLKLAKFFIDVRGDASRPERWGSEYQDHAPVRLQDEIFGHAVRAMYLCSGATDVGALTGDRPLLDAMDRLWDNMTQRKMYVTGGIGSRRQREEFGFDFELPNEDAYCETCAAVGVVFWAHRMNLLRADAKYADVAERALYNGVLSGVSLDGVRFFYVNPLASNGKHHRQSFYKCACCPPNLVRLLASLPGYAYAVGNGEIFVNLYAGGRAEVNLDGNHVRIYQSTRYPWDGNVKLTIAPDKSEMFGVCLRIPGWCEGATMSVDGAPVDPLKTEKGYARIKRKWNPENLIELNLPMPVERIEANPRVAADRGRAAVRRGPVVYCFEAVDNRGSVKNLALPRDPKFTAVYRTDLLGGVAVVEGTAEDGRKIAAVPYYAWDNRRPGEMAVWVRQEGKPASPSVDDPAWMKKLYRPLMLGLPDADTP
ncbi:MAG: glycoside hydrolase family 127 protein [Pirellulales bacterium]|nr:glycoside hydrolase family 127 protein [Pirellulales bacterium]